jgi:5-methylcytosine-specific restriction endonuclease McrA
MAGYNVANRDRNREYNRQYNSTHRGEIGERKRRYRDTPAGKAANVSQLNRRRARKLGTDDGTATTAVVARILAAPRCSYCGEPAERLELEHMTPLARGGAHSALNLTGSCEWCNGHKSTRTADEFREDLLTRVAAYFGLPLRDAPTFQRSACGSA